MKHGPFGVKAELEYTKPSSRGVIYQLNSFLRSSFTVKIYIRVQVKFRVRKLARFRIPPSTREPVIEDLPFNVAHLRNYTPPHFPLRCASKFAGVLHHPKPSLPILSTT